MRLKQKAKIHIFFLKNSNIFLTISNDYLLELKFKWKSNEIEVLTLLKQNRAIFEKNFNFS